MANSISAQPDMRRSQWLMAIALSTSIGLLGGVQYGMVMPMPMPTASLLGGFSGLLFSLLATPRAVSPGAGLVWGLAYAFLLWLALPLGICQMSWRR